VRPLRVGFETHDVLARPPCLDPMEYGNFGLESIQDGEKGQAAEAAVSSLETAIEALEEIENQVDEATSALEDSSQARQGAWL
jgi:hypothetical protein